MKYLKKKMLSLVLVLSMVFTGCLLSMEESSSRAVEKKAEVFEERCVGKTETSTVFDLGNGKKRAEFYGGAVRFTDEEGEWKDYDTSLVPVRSSTDTYVYETKQTDKNVFFPRELDENTPVVSEMGSYGIGISSKDTSCGRMKLNYEKTKSKEEEISSVGYVDVWEDTTLQYEATPNGVKEKIILDSMETGNTFDFHIELKNCSVVSQSDLKSEKIKLREELETEEGEDLFLYDLQRDRLLGSIPASFMFDSQNEYSNECIYRVSLISTQKCEGDMIYEYALKLVVDKNYLNSSERIYPVTIDPTIVWNESNKSDIASAYVCSSSPNSTYTDINTNILCVGARQNGDVCRSYIKFREIDATLKGTYVEDVKLELHTYGSDSGMPLYFRRVDSTWNGETITYSTQPKRAKWELGSFTTTKAAETVKVSLDADGFYEKTSAKENLSGIEITDSKDDSNVKSSQTAWIYNTVNINSDRMPKLEVTYYDMANVNKDASPRLQYKVYETRTGWGNYYEDGWKAGQLDADKNIRAFSMNFEPNGYAVGTVKYRAYIEGSGWTGWIAENETAGDITQNKKIKVIQMKIYNSGGAVESTYYNVYYRVYDQTYGWLGWAKNGEAAGNYQSNGSVLGIRAVVVPKLSFAQWYATKQGTDKGGSIAEESNYVTAAGDRNIIYGMGVQFKDSTMRKNHTIYTQTYLQTGATSGGVSSSPTTNSYAKYGGSMGNSVAGYQMQFNDVNLRVKYNIEHTTSSRDEDIPEESWKKNMEVSGSADGEQLEMMSVRAVPKNYVEGEKACISDQFIVSEDGYSFVNSGADFGYPHSYKISREKYIKLFGPSRGEELYQQTSWGGNCYGMALSAQMFKSHRWSWFDYVGTVDNEAESVYGLLKQPGRKSQSLTDLIEYCQLFWWAIGDYENFRTLGCSEIVSKLSGATVGKYVLYMSGSGMAHAAIPLKAYPSGNNVYSIDLYDVNYPGKVSTATIDVARNTFTYGNYDGVWLLHVDDIYNENATMFNSIPGLVNGNINALNLKNDDSVYTILLKDCASYDILDESGQSIKDSPEMKRPLAPGVIGLREYQVPLGNYIIKIGGNNVKGTVTVVNQESSVAYDISEKAIISVDLAEKKKIDAVLEFTDGLSHNSCVTTYDKNENKTRTVIEGKKIVTHGQVNKSFVKKAD